jgi:hypothetical protein
MCIGWLPLACLPAYISENLAAPRPSGNSATTSVEPHGHRIECRELYPGAAAAPTTAPAAARSADCCRSKLCVGKEELMLRKKRASPSPSPPFNQTLGT